MTERPWGRWTRLYVNEHVELRRLDIDAGGYSSPHYHETQANMIAVEHGRLIVRFLSGPDAMLVENAKVELEPRSPTVWMPSFRVHQFWAQTDVVAYELSLADPGHAMDPDEIHRLGEAGKGTPKP